MGMFEIDKNSLHNKYSIKELNEYEDYIEYEKLNNN